MNRMVKIISSGLIFILAGFILSGCDGSSTVINPPSRYDYIISGALVVDNNVTSALNDSTRIALKLKKNSTALIDADVIFDNDTLTYTYIPNSTELAYTFPSNPGGLLDSGHYQLDIIDNDNWNDNITVIVPALSNIASYNPDSTVTYNPNNSIVNLEWTASLQVEGYVVAAVLSESAYSGSGFSAYVTTLGTQMSIPPEAFYSSGTDNIVPGTYFLYVYGYTGAPDSALSSTLLPVPFPSQLPDNISHLRLGGHMGSIVISRRVPLIVVAG